MSSNQDTAPKAAILIGGLLGLLISAVSDVNFCMGALLSALAAWVVIMVVTSISLSKVRASIQERGVPVRAERDRLAQRIAQLGAGLDDLADQL
jgi:hypothetical protein